MDACFHAFKGIGNHHTYLGRPSIQKFEELGELVPLPRPCLEIPPKLDFKPLPPHLWYAFLGHSSTLSIVISSSLNQDEEDELLQVLRDHKKALG